MVIRRYAPDDSSRLFQMMRDEGSEWADYYEDEDRHGVTLERSLTYLAFDGDRLCGYVRCREDDGYGVFVYDLLVDQSCRGQNLGRRLMEHVHRDYPGQPLYVLSDNDAYYEKQGFTAIGTVFVAPFDGQP